MVSAEHSGSWAISHVRSLILSKVKQQVSQNVFAVPPHPPFFLVFLLQPSLTSSNDRTAPKACSHMPREMEILVSQDRRAHMSTFETFIIDLRHPNLIIGCGHWVVKSLNTRMFWQLPQLRFHALLAQNQSCMKFSNTLKEQKHIQHLKKTCNS